MAIRVQRHANVSKQATLLDGLDISPSNGAYMGLAEINLLSPDEVGGI